MRIESEIKLDFKDVLVRPRRTLVTSRNQVTTEVAFEFRNSKRKWSGTPVVAANMDTTGTFEIAAVLATFGMVTAMHKHYSVPDWKEWLEKTERKLQKNVMVSVGVLEADLAKLDAILALGGFEFICIDVANGYSVRFVEAIHSIRKKYPDVVLLAGNVVTAEMTSELILAGADIVKVGIGPGSVCTTRKQTGVGYPQLSAVVECAEAAHALGGHIMSDGGCACPGDVVKAFGAGADFVMLGGMFAGHDESAGELLKGDDGSYFKVFYGMSSDTAMKKYAGGVAEYRASEGKTVKIPYRGPLSATVKDILGGVRSACTYVGATNLGQLCDRIIFVRVTQQLNPVFHESLGHRPQGAVRPAAEADEPDAKRARTSA